MGLRFRRSIGLGSGVRLNLGLRGGSLSLGKRGASVNIGKRGVYTNVGIPGTGLSMRTKVGKASGLGMVSAVASVLLLLGYCVPVPSSQKRGPVTVDTGPVQPVIPYVPPVIAAAPAKPPTPAAPEAKTVALPAPALTGGLTLSEIAELQDLLNRLGHPAGTPDGKAGPRTRAALAAWAGGQGGTASLDAETLARLRLAVKATEAN